MTANQQHITDNERDSALEALGVHFAQGRLQLDEFEHRSDQALYAKTYTELDQVFADLPLPGYDSAIEPYRQAQAPKVTQQPAAQPWRSHPAPTGKTRVWKRPFGLSKKQAILIGWLITGALISLYGIGFVSTVAITESEAIALSGLFGAAGLSVITLVVMLINTILISTSYDPDADAAAPDGDNPYPY